MGLQMRCVRSLRRVGVTTSGTGRLLVSGERFPRRPLEFSVARRRAMAPTPYSRLVTASPFPAITALCLSRSMLILWRAVSPAPQPISR